MNVQISESLFWAMYGSLRDAEGVLWECNGAVNSDDVNLSEMIESCQDGITKVLDNLQPIVQSLKEKQ